MTTKKGDKHQIPRENQKISLTASVHKYMSLASYFLNYEALYIIKWREYLKRW